MRKSKVLITIIGATKFLVAPCLEALKTWDLIVRLVEFQVALQICGTGRTFETSVTSLAACVVAMEN